MGIEIRKASANDSSIIAPLFDLYRIFYKQKSDVKAAAEFIQERLLNNESVIFLAFLGSEAVGFTQLYPIFSSVSIGKAWLLNDLFVHEKARGKGVASELLDAAKQLGTETNCKWLMLQTAHDNFTAQSVYEKNGWERSEFYSYYFYL